MVARCIAVRALSGQLYECDYSEGWTVRDLRQEVASRIALPESQLDLVLGGNVLSDEGDVAELLDCDVYVVVRRTVLAVAGFVDALVRVFDIDAGTCLAALKGHSDVVLSLAVDFERMSAVSGSADNNLCVWDLKAMVLVGTLRGHADAVLAIAADFAKNVVASGSIDGTLRIWDLPTLSEVAVLCDVEASIERGLVMDVITALAADFGRQQAATGMQDGRLVLWDLVSGRSGAVLRGHTNAVTRLAADFSAARAVTSSRDGSSRVWDLAQASCLATLDAHGRRVLDMVVDFGRDFVLTCSASTLCTWDLRSMKCLAKRKANFADIEEYQIAEDFDTFDQKSVWDFEAELCDTVNKQACDLTAIGTNLHRNIAVSGHIDGSLRILDMGTWRFLQVMGGGGDKCSPLRVLCVDGFAEATLDSDG